MPDEKLEKRRAFIINFLYAAVIIACVVLFFRYGIFVLMPFLVGFFIALILRPAIAFMTGKWRMRRKFATVVSLILFYCTIGIVVTFTAIQLVNAAIDLFSSLPGLYMRQIVPAITRAADGLTQKANAWFPEFAGQIDQVSSEIAASLGTVVSSVSQNLVAWLTRRVAQIPSVLLSILITVISSFFFAIDYAEITRFVLRQMPAPMRGMTLRVKTELGATVCKYAKSYALIMLWTFFEIAVGFSIIGVKGALLIAVVIAVFDILPVVGSGMVLLPWTIATFVAGSVGRGAGLLLLYLFVVVSRNIIEPRIVGRQVGLHPIVTLMAMVVGTYAFGAIGLFTLPIMLAIAKSLNDQGIVHLYKRREPDESAAPRRAGPIDRLAARIKKGVSALWARLFPRRKKAGTDASAAQDGDAPQNPNVFNKDGEDNDRSPGL